MIEQGTMIHTLKNRDLEGLKKILEIDAALIESKDENGIPYFFLPAELGDLDMVKYIVEYTRASMNEVDSEHRNILHYAAKSNNPKLIKYLVEKVGTDSFKGDNKGIIPLDLATDPNVIESFNMSLDKMYRNPIVSGAHPDPSIIRVEEDYYMVNSTFTFFPAIPILHSKDLINWKIIGHAVTDPEYLDLTNMDDGRGIWAPDISYHKGKFYIVATLRLNDNEKIIRKQLVVSSEKPEGPYSKPNYIEEDGIDPSLFTDTDGKRYMLVNRGARIFQVNEEVTDILEEPELIYYGDNKRGPEGPHILKKDGYYYLFLAEGGTGPTHCITVSRSKNLKGPYESCPYNPILTQRDYREYIQRTGHGKPVQTQNGDWYIVYLCGRPVKSKNGEKYCILGRETALDPITWTLDGWPLINRNRGTSVINYKPNLKEFKFEVEDIHDRFLGEELKKDWLFARNPIVEKYKVLDGKLRMYGGDFDLNRKENRNTLVKRQKSFSFEAETKLTLHGAEAGLTCYYDTDTYIKLGVSEDRIYVTECIGKILKESFQIKIEGIKEIYLKVITNYMTRRFLYSLDGKNWIEAITLEDVYYLSDEGYKGKRFTGAMVGIYSLNLKKQENSYTDFEYFKYFNI